jgi:hypothetical protein
MWLWHEKTPVVDAVDAAHRPAASEDVAVEPEDIPIVDEENLAIGREPSGRRRYASTRTATQLTDHPE